MTSFQRSSGRVPSSVEPPTHESHTLQSQAEANPQSFFAPAPNHSFSSPSPSLMTQTSNVHLQPKQVTSLTATPAAPLCEERWKELKEAKLGSCWDSNLQHKRHKLSLKRARASSALLLVPAGSSIQSAQLGLFSPGYLPPTK